MQFLFLLTFLFVCFFGSKTISDSNPLQKECVGRLMGDMKRHGIFILGDETISRSNAQLKKGLSILSELDGAGRGQGGQSAGRLG